MLQGSAQENCGGDVVSCYRSVGNGPRVHAARLDDATRAAYSE